jgi:subtilisin-like proprotein convertase family protein
MMNLWKRSIERVLMVCVCLALGTLAIPAAVGSDFRAGDVKIQVLNRMTELQAEIAWAKEDLSRNPQDVKLAAYLDKLIAEYHTRSRRLGGDQPPCSEPGIQIGIPVIPKPMMAPPPPPFCAATTSAFSNSTPVTIPSGPAVITATIDVSGVGPYLWDLDLTTFIAHTFASDLDITIQSPAGTVVTLTTDNGGSNDDVFYGTLWDDSANPGGQVPYSSNNGLVTDQVYANLTLASPLVPEEAMAAFVGEDPNGTWTITISDDLAGDGGSLDSWSITVTTLDHAPDEAVTNFSSSTVVPIPSGPAVVTSTILVAGLPSPLSKVVATTFIQHTFAADLDVTLQSPAGTVVTLTTDNGGSNDNVFNGTVWDDDADPGGQVPYTANEGLVTDHTYANLVLASPLVPEEAMGAFMGEDPNGVWTLTISDDLAGDGGQLTGWSLDLTTATCQPFDLTFVDDFDRSSVCLNSETGDYQWTVIRGPGVGVYTGTGVIHYSKGMMILTANLGVGVTLEVRYDERAYKAFGQYSDWFNGIASPLSDANTTDNPPLCEISPGL